MRLASYINDRLRSTDLLCVDNNRFTASNSKQVGNVFGGICFIHKSVAALSRSVDPCHVLITLVNWTGFVVKLVCYVLPLLLVFKAA